MHSLIIEPGAEADLDQLWESGAPQAEDAVALIEAVFDELANDSEFLARMWRRQERRMAEPSIEADRIVSLWRTGRNLLRLKLWDFPEHGGALLPWRVVYAYDARSEAYHVLGVIQRDTNYETHHPHIQRILRDYDALGIPTY
ncbi:type II toxin-antitoxin system RelE/ParE family toxin [Bordetella sp. BOR01]|nr:type II toxin-antitoxin system RelE/ParE family toxin [Bordetella sp. BOR01]